MESGPYLTWKYYLR